MNKAVTVRLAMFNFQSSIFNISLFFAPMSKFLIVGLGNPGAEYANTRHNVGFVIADALAESLIKEEEKGKKLFATEKLVLLNHSKFKGKQLVIIKPVTYMNLSGKAVNYWMQTEKIPVENILVVTDDLALPFGTLRLLKKGGPGGHNGLTDIIETLNTQEFARLRFGIGSEFSKGQQVDYVLGTWNEAQQQALTERINKSVEIIKSFIVAGIERTMTAFNRG
jgi:peptidyl-tRNA hydrolase, PTH1 family